MRLHCWRIKPSTCLEWLILLWYNLCEHIEYICTVYAPLTLPVIHTLQVLPCRTFKLHTYYQALDGEPTNVDMDCMNSLHTFTYTCGWMTWIVTPCKECVTCLYKRPTFSLCVELHNLPKMRYIYVWKINLLSDASH